MIPISLQAGAELGMQHFPGFVDLGKFGLQLRNP
jgi:hypothetical protein